MGKYLRKFHINGPALFFLAPSICGFSVFYLIPFLGGIYYSFIDNPVGSRFVGLTNYMRLLSNPMFQKAGINTLLFTAVTVPLNMILSLGLALLLNKGVWGKKALQTAFIVPMVIPVASVVLVWQVLFDSRGALNGALQALGLTGTDWMNTGWARWVVVLLYLWKNLGYNMVLFLAGLKSIPAEYYESAQMDGAGAGTRFRSITLPYLTPTAFFVFIMSVINSFKVFRETYLISGAYPQDGMYMLQHYMNNMFTAMDYQKLTSAAFIMAVLIYMLILVLFRYERKIVETL